MGECKDLLNCVPPTRFAVSCLYPARRIPSPHPIYINTARCGYLRTHSLPLLLENDTSAPIRSPRCFVLVLSSPQRRSSWLFCALCCTCTAPQPTFGRTVDTNHSPALPRDLSAESPAPTVVCFAPCTLSTKAALLRPAWSWFVNLHTGPTRTTQQHHSQPP